MKIYEFTQQETTQPVNEAPLIGPEGNIHRAASADQSDREYIKQRMFKDKWKKENPGKKWPGYNKAGFTFEGLPDALMGAKDPVIVVYNQKGQPVDRLALSVAANKYNFDVKNVRQQFKHQDKVKINNITLSAPIAGQPTNEEITLEDDQDFHEEFGDLAYVDEEGIFEAEYQGRKVKLNKPMQGDVKKFKVYVKNDKGNVVKVNFGDPNMRIKKSNPARRKSFRARHNCDNPGPKWKARYWSCRAW